MGLARRDMKPARRENDVADSSSLHAANGTSPSAKTWLPSVTAPAVEPPTDSGLEGRTLAFGCLYVTYMTFLACRKNYGFWLPSVLERLQKSKSEAGAIGSALEMSYGLCSLLNGVLIDSHPPRTLLIGALLLTAVLNLLVGATDSLMAMAALWALNGAVQSIGWPSVTNVFLAWFPDPAARGAWYSLLSTCQNAGAALVPLFLVTAIQLCGWRAALWVPAALAAATAAFLALLLHGSPADAQRAAEARRGTGGNGSASPTSRSPTSAHAVEQAAHKNQSAIRSVRASLAAVLGKQVVLNRALWVMAINYFGVSLVRSYLSDWSSVFLAEAKGLALNEVARCLFLLEAGGFGGSLVAGALSDRLFAGRRGPVVAICSALLAPLMLCLRSAHSPLALQAIYAGLGLCAFPVHVLLGLFSREVVPPAVSSSAGGFVKCIAQIGGAFAGAPLGWLQQGYGWDGVQLALAITSILSAVAACTLWSTTAAGRINGRHGTVQDFSAINKAGSATKNKDM